MAMAARVGGRGGRIPPEVFLKLMFFFIKYFNYQRSIAFCSSKICPIK